ncbi:PEP/pyruvate-binding domain-containing protein [Phytomonospora sp. NPDC050363]|uniref:PEP/pyruvate-binding domain-containing protein n=1 Tax=Phytomonospora sp. NPDC050363 TaxID=3155642 RepID=UPI0033DD8219
MPVPEGFAVPFAAHRADLDALRRVVAEALARMGDPPVAVRSSAANEDTPGASAAGQYESFLAVQGAKAVTDAIRDCWDSASAARVADYWRHAGGTTSSVPPMAVLVQRHIDAEVSGVMFTPSRPGDSTRIEASWGLGLTVVGGTVTPDAFEVGADGTVGRTIGDKTTRLDRHEGNAGVVARGVPEHQRALPALSDAAAAHLAALGGRVAGLFGGSQDIEWAVAGGTTWLLQARPVTAPLPPAPNGSPSFAAAALRGAPGAHGVATGTARIVGGPGDFQRVQAGDIVICPYTDPAWTPLFTIAGGVVTEIGGTLSHAAIVAREYGIPAVLGITGAMTRVHDGARVTLDGTAGTLTPH